MNHIRIVVAALFIVLIAGCQKKDPGGDPVLDTTTTKPPATATPAPANGVPTYGFQIVHSYPHDPLAFTQGLLYDNGVLYEGTGLNDSSNVRKVDLATGNVLRNYKIGSQYFGEGLALLHDKLYEITWQNNLCFVYSLNTFQPLDTFIYGGEGWGLTTDGTQLIMSDGSNSIHFRDPATFEIKRTILVFDGNTPVGNLNELEYVKGEIYANIWKTDSIVRIDPKDGKLLGWINMKGLLSASDRTGREDVLNGIAYDEKGDRLFVTGKHWAKLFEIKLTGGPAAAEKPTLK